MRGNTWVLLGEWGRGYRGTSERQHMGTTGGNGLVGATEALVRGNTCCFVYWGNGGGATEALVRGNTWVLLGGMA